MSKYSTFAFIGGDRRQIYVIKGFANDGKKVNVVGINHDNLLNQENITIYNNIENAIKGADVVVLPLPYSSILNNDNINTPLSETDIKINDLSGDGSLLSNKLILAGKVDSRLADLANKTNTTVIDYMERDELAILNAIPTAEGAVKIAMEELPITLHGSNCLCLGFGRVGKVLCHTLHNLGANVTAAARRKSDLAYITAYGYLGANILSPLDNPQKYDVVFNTVPQMIVDEDLLKKLRDDCLIIDLASKPGGVDFILDKYYHT